ncbi:MAG: GNAT family N-acetyltransferase [Ignavibacteriaceae bacterium]
MLEAINTFKEKDINVALELIDIALNSPDQDDYHIFVYEEEYNVLGYHCTGRRPITDAVFDLYWIVVHPDSAGKGIGKKLLAHSEEFVKENNGRWILAETSSKETYEATRLFYIKNNYNVIAQIEHFYSFGEALVIYGKYLWTKS